MSDVAWIIEGLKKPGKTQVGLAEALGRAPSAVTSLLKGKRELKAREVPIVRAYLETPEAPTVIRPAGPEKSEVEFVGEGYPDTGDEWMDLRGVVEGGADGGFEFGNVIDQVRRPPGLRKAKHVAALNVAGESMSPRFRPGELIYVHQRLAVPGDDVVIEMYPEHDGDAPKAFLKEFIRKTGLRIFCRQHNPVREIEFDAGEVRTVWRVVPLRELLF